MASTPDGCSGNARSGLAAGSDHPVQVAAAVAGDGGESG